MTTKNSYLADDEDFVLSNILKVLSDPTRIKMLRLLHQSEREMTCGEVGEALDLSKSIVSYHFKILRSVGLTNTRREGQNKFLSVREENFEKHLSGFLDSL